jgi:hypothetical protein
MKALAVGTTARFQVGPHGTQHGTQHWTQHWTQHGTQHGTEHGTQHGTHAKRISLSLSSLHAQRRLPGRRLRF